MLVAFAKDFGQKIEVVSLSESLHTCCQLPFVQSVQLAAELTTYLTLVS